MQTPVTLNSLSPDKIPEASAFLAQCWRAAYRGIINDGYLDALADTHWVDFLEKSLTAKTAAGTLAEQDGKTIGLSVFGKSITEQYPDDGEIISLYVSPQSIGQKIGHLLFANAEQALREQGYPGSIVCVFAENRKAIRFYESHGYEIVMQDQQIKMGVQGLRYVIMRKAL